MTIDRTTLKTTLLASAALALAGLGSESASAATDSSNQSITVTNQTTCSITVDDVDLGTLTDQEEVQQTFQMTVYCPVDPDGVVLMQADGGLNVMGAAMTQRFLKGGVSGNDLMEYEIYRGTSFTGFEPAIGDDGITHTQPSFSDSPNTFDFVVVIPFSVTPRKPGTFNDTVVWTVTY